MRQLDITASQTDKSCLDIDSTVTDCFEYWLFVVPRPKPPVAKKPPKYQRANMARSQSTPSELESTNSQSASQATPSHGPRSSSVSVEGTPYYTPSSTVSNGPCSESE